MPIEYKGTRWFKCDLHLHTTASMCFEDKPVTPEQWVNRAIEQGLNCVAVTDHNTGLSIDAIKEAAEEKNLTVFPGVEITCDASKVHLLVLFDVTKTSNDIRDFLVRADIKAEAFGKQEASTVKSIFEIAELAHKDGALIIPAHIDEYNGLGSVSVGNLTKLYRDYNINAVQVVHKEFLIESLQTTGNNELKKLLNDYYNSPNPPIDDATIKEWYTPVKYALKENLAIVTFSDNPHEPKDPKHGLWGIGSHYTWIKMDQTPSLEGLRQAFLLPEYRVKNEFESKHVPYTSPNLWIKSISISNTTLTDVKEPLIIDFNPQLNAIIGGRGSGKSSVLRFIRGLFNKTADLADLEDIKKDQNEFYCIQSGRPKKGVLLEGSEICIEFIRNNVNHKILASDIVNSENQTITIEKFDETSSSWIPVTDEGYIEFFEYEHYSQKQIYEIAQEPNALRERIDSAIGGIDKLKIEREHIKSLFLEKSAQIRTIDQLIAGQGKFETRVKDLETSIKRLQQSGIAEILTTKEKFNIEEEILENFKSKIEERENALKELAASIELQDLEYNGFDENHSTELAEHSKTVVDRIARIREELDALAMTTQNLKESYEESLNSSEWKSDHDKNILQFNTKKEELEEDGIDDIANFEKLSEDKSNIEKTLESIYEKQKIRDNELKERQKLQDEYIEVSTKISQARTEFVNSILKDGKVKIMIKKFRNKNDFEIQLRKILQRTGTDRFQKDIDKLSDLCFNGLVEKKINEVRDVFLKIRKGDDVSDIVSGHFVNLVKSLYDAQIDEIELFLPEDEIEVQYKPTNISPFKSLSTASAGQKTTAILTFILSFGNVPLILDQPEDDLDNRLVYELIVDRLKNAKESRQLIVVTHNANVPVNGDAEYIISMDTDSKTLSIIYSGTVEQLDIKKEICDVMEGGEKAFKMRSKRYRLIN